MKIFWNYLSKKVRTKIIGDTMYMMRDEYTVLPRFAYHQPTDYHLNSYPVSFKESVQVEGEPLPLPPGDVRMGYFPEDDGGYLESGKVDRDIILNFIKKYHSIDNLSVLDLGCSSGRVLRHFHEYQSTHGWKLSGADIQAMPIEWLRLNFPKEYCVFTNSVMPHIPLEDNSVDVIYGISVFTHIKYLWDAWLLELKRVLKKGGLLIMTIHSETAWKFYHEHKDEEWVKAAHSHEMINTPEMEVPWFQYGDISCSQSFYQKDTAREYWGRYYDVLEIHPPVSGFQDWVVCRNT